jgi:trimethylamine--corrinoid protein Co-methyltransferase
MSGARTWGALALTGTTDVGSILQLLIDLEMVAYVERLLRGVDVDDERIGVEEIVQTAPRGAYFLGTGQTVEFFRDELWMPELMDRRAPMSWAQAPSDMVERAREKMKHVVASAENRSPLTSSQRQQIDEIVAEADRVADVAR